MNGFKKVISIVLVVMLVVTCGMLSVNAATTDTQEAQAGSGITIHYYGSSTVPNIYYWNSLPTNISSPTYPGPKMTKDTSAQGSNCYTYSFSNVTQNLQENMRRNHKVTGGIRTTDGIHQTLTHLTLLRNVQI